MHEHARDATADATRATADAWRAAAALAARAHRHQIRKDGRTPYIAHPVRVALLLRHEWGCDDGVVLAAALLHDVIEDCGCDFEDVERASGTETARVVGALTKRADLPEAGRDEENRVRVVALGWRAVLVRAADTIDNLLDLPTLGREDDDAAARMRTRAAGVLAMVNEAAARERDGRVAAWLAEAARHLTAALRAAETPHGAG